jgi:NADH:ubiquinone oxidoreductase subunit E
LSQTSVVDDVAVIAKRWKNTRGRLIMALHDLQNRYGYVPRESAMKLAKYMDVPLARIYEVITFYNYFKLKAPGKHVVSVCTGTACYLKGASEIYQNVTQYLGIKSGETTPDGEFHLQMVRCLGCCGLSPVMTINGKLFAKVSPKDIPDHLSQCKNGGEK